MTNRELYTATIAALKGEDTSATTDELIEALESAISKLDHANEQRKIKAAEKAVEKQAEKAPIREALLGVMSNEEPMTATQLIEAAELEEVKPASVPSLMKPYVEEGVVLKVDVKVPGKGKQRGYILA